MKNFLRTPLWLIVIPLAFRHSNNYGASASDLSAQRLTAQPPIGASNFTSGKGFVLDDGTPVKMRINRTVSSGDAQVGDTVDFEVLEDNSVNGTLVIAKGVLGLATVTRAQAKRRMARGGKLDINIDYVKLVNRDKVALRAVRDMRGGGHTGAMVGGMVAILIVAAADLLSGDSPCLLFSLKRG